MLSVIFYTSNFYAFSHWTLMSFINYKLLIWLVYKICFTVPLSFYFISNNIKSVKVCETKRHTHDRSLKQQFLTEDKIYIYSYSYSSYHQQLYHNYLEQRALIWRIWFAAL